MRTPWLPLVLLVCLPGVASAQEPTPPPPPAPAPVRFGGYIQYDYRAPLGEAADRGDTFRFRRVRLQASGTVNEHIAWAVSLETVPSPALRDAFLTLRYFPAATIRVGQLVMPYGLEQYIFSSNTVAFTERVAGELIASRDAGLMVSNERPLFGWFSYAAGIVNGTRQNNPDNNSAKDGIVRFTASPPQVPGLHVSVNGMKGDQPEGMRTRSGADVTFERRRFHFAAEIDRERTGDGPVKRAAYAFGAWRIYPNTSRPGFHHLELGARYGRTRNLVTPVNQVDLAVNYYLAQNVRFMFDLVLHQDRVAGVPPSTLHARANIRF